MKSERYILILITALLASLPALSVSEEVKQLPDASTELQDASYYPNSADNKLEVDCLLTPSIDAEIASPVVGCSGVINGQSWRYCRAGGHTF